MSAAVQPRILITVQHAESEHHVNGHIGAWGDWPLTPHGREQAAAIGCWLRDREPECLGARLVSSDLARARQTAQEIGQALGLSPELDPSLREVNAGAGNGRTREWYQEHALPWPDRWDPDHKPFPDAESDRELWARLEPVARQLRAGEDGCLVLVSHGTALWFLQCQLLGFSLEDLGRVRFRGRAGSLSKFVFQPDGRLVVEYLDHRLW